MVYLLINFRERPARYSHYLKGWLWAERKITQWKTLAKSEKKVEVLLEEHWVLGLDDGLGCSRYKKFENLTGINIVFRLLEITQNKKKFAIYDTFF